MEKYDNVNTNSKMADEKPPVYVLYRKGNKVWILFKSFFVIINSR